MKNFTVDIASGDEQCGRHFKVRANNVYAAIRRAYKMANKMYANGTLDLDREYFAKQVYAGHNGWRGPCVWDCYAGKYTNTF